MLEKADDVGGTWLVNRYPGARCDIESIEYSYSFSDEIQQEWVWTETMPAQPEIEAYLNFVADRLDLRRDIAFGTEVVAMTFDEDAAVGARDATGERSWPRSWSRRRASCRCRWSPTSPAWTPSPAIRCSPADGPARASTSRGKRVGVIGTGSTGVQLIPVVARQAEQLVGLPALAGLHAAVDGARIRTR